MKELMAQPGSGPITMSSREIAELCEKRHDHVLRYFEKMMEDLGEDAPNFGGIYQDAYGRDQREYRLPKREALILVSGYSAVLRAKVVDRWIQLEFGAADPMQVLNDPASMRGLLLGYTEKVLALQAQVTEAKPKTEFFDKFINADGLYNLQNGARALGARPNLFIRWLKTKHLFYQGKALVPRINFIQMGIFEVKSEIIEGTAYYQTFITPKGIEYFSTRIPPEIRAAAA